jgi:glycosyltransferase involved in cell wall biosynthesis
MLLTHVYFNGRFMSRPITGVERYGWEIIREIDALCTEGHAATLGLDFEIVRPKGFISQQPFTHIRTTIVGSRTGHLWEQFDLPRYAKDGILVNLCNFAPLVGSTNVTCVHDANVYLMPSNYSSRFRTAYRILLPLVIRRSQKWVTVSRYSADQLAYFHISNRAPDAIVGDGSEHILRLNPSLSRLASADLPRPFIFAMGSRSPNKNIDLILSLAGSLRSEGISIVLAGGVNVDVFGTSAAINHDLAFELGRIEDHDIAYLFSRALCFTFPSFYEGFGIPAVEAMACGCPVISANTSAMPEVLGDAALYCSPADASAWLAAIRKLNSTPDLRADLVARGRKRAAHYSWRESALRLIEVMRAELI